MSAIDALATDARRTLLQVLACMVSADGEVTDEERAAFRGAAIALGEPDVQLEDGERELPRLALTPREAMLVYSAAHWMAFADAVQLRDESRLLERLRAALRIDADTARLLSAHARWVRTSSELPGTARSIS
jgi:tellurite resistance protein